MEENIQIYQGMEVPMEALNYNTLEPKSSLKRTKIQNENPFDDNYYKARKENSVLLYKTEEENTLIAKDKKTFEEILKNGIEIGAYEMPITKMENSDSYAPSIKKSEDTGKYLFKRNLRSMMEFKEKENLKSISQRLEKEKGLRLFDLDGEGEKKQVSKRVQEEKEMAYISLKTSDLDIRENLIIKTENEYEFPSNTTGEKLIFKI